MAAAPRADWLAILETHADDLTRTLRRQLADSAQTLDWLSRRLVSPSAYIVHERLKLRGLQTRLAHVTRTPLNQARFALSYLQAKLSAQLPTTTTIRMHLADEARRMTSRMRTLTVQRRQRLESLAAQLELHNTPRPRERGYALVQDTTGRILRTPKELRPRETMTVRLAEGSAEVGIASVQPLLE